MVQQTGDAAAAIDAAPHRLELDLAIERSASMPLEGKGVLARWDADDQSLLVHTSTQTSTERAAGDRRQARPAGRPGRGGHARRRRRLRRQDRAPVARGGAGAVGRACGSAGR